MGEKPFERIASVDILRGIAVLQMIFWQIFDFLAKTDIYSTPPFFIGEFNMPPHFSVFILFMSMSGASLYVSIARKMKTGLSKKDLTKHVLKRYGKLVLISLFFTSFVFSFCTFFGWDEAAQGIGLTAIIIFLILLINPSTKILAALALFLFLLKPVLMGSILEYVENYPKCVMEYNFAIFVSSLTINSFVRGFFSVFNLLPLMITGIIFIKMIKSNRLNFRRSAFVGGGMVLTAIILHFLGLRIDFYMRSYSSILLEIGTVLALYTIIEYLSKKKLNRILNPLENFGKGAFIAYFAHFLFIYKPLQLLNLTKSLSLGMAALVSVPLVAAIYLAINFWSKRKLAK
jgi:uncharacterized membrane protein